MVSNHCEGNSLFYEQVFMLVDDFAHQHLAAHIRVEAVDAELGVHDLMAGVVEIGFQIDIIGLAAYPGIDLQQFGLPFLIRGSMEGKLDIGRIDGHERQEDGADIVGLAFLTYGIQITDDEVRLHIGGPQAVGAGQDDEVAWLEGQYILIETLQGHGGGIAAAPQIQAGKIEIRRITVFQSSR